MTGPTITIRAATREDAPTLGRLGALLVGTHHDLDPARFLAATSRTEYGYASFLAAQLTNPRVVILVAEGSGEVLGYAYAELEDVDYMALRGPAGVLHDLVVDPGQRGQGIGRRLLDEIVAGLAARGVPRIVLSTAERNAAAQRLFERAGFRRTMIEMTRDVAELGA